MNKYLKKMWHVVSSLGNSINMLRFVNGGILFVMSTALAHAAETKHTKIVANLSQLYSNMKLMGADFIKIIEVIITATGIFFVTKGLFLLKDQGGGQGKGSSLNKAVLCMAIGSSCIGFVAIAKILDVGLFGHATWTAPTNPGFQVA